MPLQTKFALSFAFLVALLVGGFLFHVDFVLQQAFYDQASRNFQSIASANESAYFTFTRVLKTRTIDWGSDGYIRGTLERLLAAPKEKRGAIADELTQYLRTRKLPYDVSVSAVDFFDLEGNILVSSDARRLNASAGPETAFIASHSGTFGYADLGFLGSGTHNDDGLDVHVVTRMFALQTDAAGALRPMDAVLMLHFKNIGELGAVFSGELGRHEGLLGGKVLDGRPGAEVYLVGPDNAIVASSRPFANPARLSAKIAPVAACRERGEGFSGVYVNHLGVEVFGASVCARGDNTVIIVESPASDVFGPYRLFRVQVILAGMLVVLLGFLGTSILSRQLLRDFAHIIDNAAEAVRSGFKTPAKEKYSGELAGLSASINRMLGEIARIQEELRTTNAGLSARVKERTDELERLKANLEDEVGARTKEAKAKLKELEQFRALFVERELKMIELKKEVARLEGQMKNKRV